MRCLGTAIDRVKPNRCSHQQMHQIASGCYYFTLYFLKYILVFVFDSFPKFLSPVTKIQEMDQTQIQEYIKEYKGL